MGRQAYLTRLALGRSAFEPSQGLSSSSEHVQLESSQQEGLVAARDSNTNNYIQLYDERGNPINPSAREHGRRSREAQNDVLASIGVLERRQSPSADLPGTYEEQIEQLENEDSAGNAVALASTLLENLCCWWVGSLKNRIIAFNAPHSVTFVEFVTSELRIHGKSLLYAGFAARLLSTVCVQASYYAAMVLRPLDRLLFATKANRKTRHGLRRWQHTMNNCYRLFLEVLFYPFAYHASLQRLGLAPGWPLLPSWRSFIPFSASSPIRPFHLSTGLGSAAVLECVNAAMTSPLVFLCLEHFMDRWVYALIYEAIETTTIHPDNPDLVAPDDGVKDRATAILGLRRKSPYPVRNAVNKFLVALGWGNPFKQSEAKVQPPQSHREPGTQPAQRVEVGGRPSTNVSRLNIPSAHEGMLPVAGEHQAGNTTVPAIALPDGRVPASPTASEVSAEGDDPRIRITSREGIVEMEVRLPPHVLPTRTEVSGTNAPSPNPDGIASPLPVTESGIVPYHRVTQLSTEPAQMLGAICKSQLVSWVALPLKLVTLRLIASHYLSRRHGHGDVPIGLSAYRSFHPWNGLHDFSLRSAGMLLSRTMLCTGVEIAIDLSLWGCQYAVVTWIGKRYFGWGML